MLLTSRRYLNKLVNHREVPYHLHPLSEQATVRLLLDNLQRKIESSEMQELLEYKIPPTHPMNEYFHLLNTEKMTMSNHPFTILLGGHPQAILLGASMLETQSLTQLFEQLLDSNIIDALDNEQADQSYASLRMSLNLSIKNIEQSTPEALNLFKLIGMLPSGVTQKEIAKLWENNKWMSSKNQLLRVSLLVYKQSEDLLSMLPFMSTKAIELLEADPATKSKFHLNICHMYKDYCMSFLEKLNDGKYDLNEFIQKEANIWACIYRGINRKKDNDEFDGEQDKSMKMKRSLTINTRHNELKRNGSLARDKSKEAIKTPLINKYIFPIMEDDEDFASSRNSLENENTVMEDEIISIESDSSGEFSSDEPYLASNKSIRKLSPSGMEKIKTVNSFSNMSTISITNQIPLRSTHSTAPNTFKVEELLVLNYVSIAIRLCKLSDGRKAIKEYSIKEVLSYKAHAHLHQFQGVIELISDTRDLDIVCEHFDEAIKFYKKAESIIGVSICQLAIIRAKYEQYALDHKIEDLKKLSHKVEQLKQNFDSLKHKLGADRAEELIN